MAPFLHHAAGHDPVRGWDSHPNEGLAVRSFDLEKMGRRGKLNPPQASKRGRKEKPSLGEVHRCNDGGIERRESQREVYDPHGLSPDRSNLNLAEAPQPLEAAIAR